MGFSRDWIISVFGLLAVVATACEAPKPAPECDIVVKPLIIECIAHGGQNCVSEVERLNGCRYGR